MKATLGMETMLVVSMNKARIIESQKSKRFTPPEGSDSRVGHVRSLHRALQLGADKALRRIADRNS